MFRRLLRRSSRPSVPPAPPVPLVLYTRRGCHLCEVMRAQLADARLPAHTLAEVDIEGDPTLEARHGRSIPVLAIGGRTAFKGRLDPDALPRTFERLAAAWRADGAGR